MSWRPAALCAVVLLAGCGGSPAPTHEDLALKACISALSQQLGVSGDETPTQTQMIGRREYGWLVRGLSVRTRAEPARNFECRLDEDGSGPPTLTYLRFCEAGKSPWGCPRASS